MVKVMVTDRDGLTRDVDCPENQSLMMGLKGQGYEIMAICGGALSCGTCHVFVAPDDFDRLTAPTDIESELLEEVESYRPASSRLSCQIPVVGALEGLSLTLAPEE
jgi:2Fe-2S ferredoxin